MYINFQATINHLTSRNYSTCFCFPIATLLPQNILCCHSTQRAP